MSVTAKSRSATSNESRNALILAEWEAKQERSAEHRRQDPEAFAHLDALADMLNGGKETSDDEKRARSLAWHAERSALWCSRCRSEFSEGEVVYRKRVPRGPGVLGASWTLEAICDKCVRENMHPSWREHRREPVPCAGGCGVLVSHWYQDYRAVGWANIKGWARYDDDVLPAMRTCSTRCTKRAARERRRAPEVEKACDECGERFTPMRVDGRYCSNACRQRAYRKRKP